MALPNTATASLVSHRVVVVVFPRVQSLDVVGAVEVFADANKQAEAHGLPFVYDIQVAAPVAGLVETSSGIPFLATASLEQITGPLDTLLIGSGRGAREAAANETLIAVIRRLAVSANWVVSVCTGAFPLAATGLLDGRRAATHWARCKEFSQKFPSVRVDPDAIYVTDGKFHTSAGGTASIDLALSLVEGDLGRATALASACQLVVYLKRPGGQAQFSNHLMIEIEQRASDRISALLGWMIEHLDQNLSVEQLASRAAMSSQEFRASLQGGGWREPRAIRSTFAARCGSSPSYGRRAADRSDRCAMRLRRARNDAPRVSTPSPRGAAAIQRALPTHQVCGHRTSHSFRKFTD